MVRLSADATGRLVVRDEQRIVTETVFATSLADDVTQRCAGADMLDDAAAQAQLDEAAQLLTEAGFVQYLPRRWAKPGCEDKFWQGAANGMDVLAFGLSAYTRLDGMITTNTSDLNTYLAHSADYEQITVSTVPVQTAE